MYLQTADTRVRSATVGDHHSHHDFIGTRCIGHPRFHGVEMAAHKRRVFVTQWDIDRCAQCALFFGRRHQCSAFFNGCTQRRAQLGVQNGRRVLKLLWARG